MTRHLNSIFTRQRLSVDELNKRFSAMTFAERIAAIYEYFPENEVLVTSSFGTKSVFMLHLIHQHRPDQTVHFIDTGYHFPETLAYKEQLVKKFDLDVVDVKASEKAHAETLSTEMWRTDTERCCAINKVEPLDHIKQDYTVWMSGVMGYQTDFRANLNIFEEQDGILKFHPIVDIDEGEFLYHMAFHKLPHHPLEELGYGSVGCTHCTKAGTGRAGRWEGQEKTECGLHPGYLMNKANR